MRHKALKVLWNGKGQDSAAILTLLLHDPVFRTRFVGEADLITVSSDTGNEWNDTVQYLPLMEDLCRRAEIPFYHLTPDMGFHGKTWPSLQAQMQANDSIMAMGLHRTCTDNLKLKPNYRFLEAFVAERYGYPFEGKKKTLYRYAQQWGKLEVFVGFGKGEERRCATTPQLELFPKAKSKKDKRPPWMKQTIQIRYPLIEWGLDRAGAQDIIRHYGEVVPPPSCCKMCPFQNENNVLLLYRTDRPAWDEWVEREAAKLSRNAGIPVNHGVKGANITLPQFLEKAEAKWGHLSTDELRQMRYQFGHGVASKY